MSVHHFYFSTVCPLVSVLPSLDVNYLAHNMNLIQIPVLSLLSTLPPSFLSSFPPSFLSPVPASSFFLSPFFHLLSPSAFLSLSIFPRTLSLYRCQIHYSYTFFIYYEGDYCSLHPFLLFAVLFPKRRGEAGININIHHSLYYFGKENKWESSSLFPVRVVMKEMSIN